MKRSTTLFAVLALAATIAVAIPLARHLQSDSAQTLAASARSSPQPISASGTASPSPRGGSGTISGSRPGPPSSSSSATAAPQAGSVSPTFVLGVRFAHSCVVPGDQQEIFVQSRPGYVVAYNATYSDGKPGTDYGGVGYSPTNSDGSYQSTWVVAPSAPLGTVTVDAGTQRRQETPITTRATFTVAAQC